jgi:hypothetical protein
MGQTVPVPQLKYKQDVAVNDIGDSYEAKINCIGKAMSLFSRPYV